MGFQFDNQKETQTSSLSLAVSVGFCFTVIVMESSQLLRWNLSFEHLHECHVPVTAELLLNSRGECGLVTCSSSCTDLLVSTKYSGGPFCCRSSSGSVGLLCLSRPTLTSQSCDFPAGIRSSCPGPGASPTQPSVLCPEQLAGFAQEGAVGVPRCSQNASPASSLGGV